MRLVSLSLRGNLLLDDVSVLIWLGASTRLYSGHCLSRHALSSHCQLMSAEARHSGVTSLGSLSFLLHL